MEVFTGFMIGLLGSFHCVGMCGPIALALPVTSKSQTVILISRILYNLGRVVTYTAMGALFGLFGHRLVLIGLQESISIIIGTVIIVSVLAPSKIKKLVTDSKPYRYVSDLVKQSFNKLASSTSFKSFFWFGIINGMLPCGFVYVAIAGAVTTGGILEGSLFMMLFGFGTFPIMLGTSLLGKYLNRSIRNRINKLIPLLALLLGIIFLLRGLGLGIPYLSPKLNSPVANEDIICH